MRQDRYTLPGKLAVDEQRGLLLLLLVALFRIMCRKCVVLR